MELRKVVGMTLAGTALMSSIQSAVAETRAVAGQIGVLGEWDLTATVVNNQAAQDGRGQALSI